MIVSAMVGTVSPPGWGEDRSGTFWVGNRDGLDAFDRRSGTVILHIPVPDLIQVSFFEDRVGRFWITQVNGNGLSLFDRSNHTLTRYSFYARNPPPGNYTGVTGIVEDHQGHLWLGSPGAGLLRFEPENGRFVRYRNRPHDRFVSGGDLSPRRHPGVPVRSDRDPQSRSHVGRTTQRREHEPESSDEPR